MKSPNRLTSVHINNNVFKNINKRAIFMIRDVVFDFLNIENIEKYKKRANTSSAMHLNTGKHMFKVSWEHDVFSK